jgi:hypothetical protein
MMKQMVAVWCNYTETRCIRRVIGDNQRQALDYARVNGWYINGHDHLCPFHKPKG